MTVSVENELLEVLCFAINLCSQGCLSLGATNAMPIRHEGIQFLAMATAFHEATYWLTGQRIALFVQLNI
jgi:hypothetical protein